MSHHSIILSSLEHAAALNFDMSASAYEKFFQKSPQSEALMENIDDRVRGRMMDEVLTLFLTEDMEPERDYIKFEIDAHIAYRVTPDH